MLEGITKVVYEANMKWKRASTEFMVGLGSADRDRHERIVIRAPDDTDVLYKCCEAMMVLGSAIGNSGSTTRTLEHRMMQAEALFWSKAKDLCRRASCVVKLRAWNSAVVSSLIHDCESWHLTKNILQRIKTWEYKMCRRMFNMRHRPAETHGTFLWRTAVWLQKQWRKAGLLRAHEQAVVRVLRVGHDENGTPMRDGTRPLTRARTHRNAMWWTAIKAIASGAKERRKEGLVRRQTCHAAAWEDMLVEFQGEDWRSKVNLRTRAQWAKEVARLQNVITTGWGIVRSADLDEPGEHAAGWPGGQRVSDAQIEWANKNVNGHHPEELSWRKDKKLFKIVVDNQTLAKLVNGKAVCTDERYERDLSDIVHNMPLLSTSTEWQLAEPWRDWVLWRPRCWNHLADKVVNNVMDGVQNPWKLVDPDDHDHGDPGNIVLTTDGGARGVTTAAAGWAIQKWQRQGESDQWNAHVIASGGGSLAPGTTAFAAEIKGLKWVVEEVIRACRTSR